MKRNICLLISVTVLGTSWLAARNFWEKTFTEWKQQEVLKMLTSSPWSSQHVFTRNLIRSGPDGQEGVFESGGIGGDKESFDAYTVRFFSSLPIRRAYVRLLQLNNKYDQMPAEQKQQFDTQTNAFLNAGREDIIMALDFTSNDQALSMNVRRKLHSMRAPQLQGMVYLSTNRIKEIALKEYFPPGEDGTGAKFVFPRTMEGEPVLTPKDKEVKFTLEMPEFGHTVFVKWKVKDMMYEGELAH